MPVFISYARRDAEVVARLHGDLERARVDAWFDRDLEGGERWWDGITAQIRACDLFVFVLSPDSVRSRPCRAELAYAVALGRPLLPVLVRDVRVDLAPDPIGATQIVDYRTRNADTAIDLVLAVSRTRQDVALPDPVPPPPPAPITDMGPLRERVAAPELGFAEQQELLAALRRHVDDVDQRDLLVALLEEFRRRPDVVSSVAADIDAFVTSLPVTDADWSPQRGGPTRRRLAERDPDTVDLLRSMVSHIRGGHFTPILGPGLTDALIGPRRLLARQWARSFEFPMAEHHHDDLPGVAQFITVMTNAATLQSSFGEYLRTRLAERGGDASTADLSAVLRSVWERERAENEAEPHAVLASLPCPIYVNAHPSGVLVDALRAAGREPVVELCRWKQDVYDWPASVFDTEPGYAPSVQRPLVYHVFGTLDFPDSLVLTEDDYFDFLVGVTQERTLVPPVVRRVLADSALLLLGFGLEEWDVRVLLRTLVNQGGAHKLHRYTHVAAQVDLTQGVVSPARAQRYLERYFGKYREPSMDIYWGTVEELCGDLAEVWGGRP